MALARYILWEQFVRCTPDILYQHNQYSMYLSTTSPQTKYYINDSKNYIVVLSPIFLLSRADSWFFARVVEFFIVMYFTLTTITLLFQSSRFWYKS